MLETKFKKFQPLNKFAMIKINELLLRDGELILETKSFVEIQRMNSIARVDQVGRVEWRQA